MKSLLFYFSGVLQVLQILVTNMCNSNATQVLIQETFLRPTGILLQLVLLSFLNAFKLRSPSLSLCALTAECQFLRAPFCKI